MKGRCPPEDRGGAWGYAELKETIADPSNEEHEEVLEWLGVEDTSDFAPAAFHLASVNAHLRAPSAEHSASTLKRDDQHTTVGGCCWHAGRGNPH